MTLTGESRRTLRKTCPIVTLSTTNPTRSDQGANPGPHGKKLASNNYLNHGKTLHTASVSLFITTLGNADGSIHVASLIPANNSARDLLAKMWKIVTQEESKSIYVAGVKFSDTKGINPLVIAEFLTAVKMLVLFYCVVTPCGLTGRYQRFGETYCFHLWTLNMELQSIKHRDSNPLHFSLICESKTITFFLLFMLFSIPRNLLFIFVLFAFSR
jgi:hypothetical protein